MAAYEQLVSVSGAATNGQIPQANGSGGYAWVTPAAGVNPSSATPAMDGTGAAGTSADYARGDHVHPTDTSRAPLASPTFTGTPSAPTAAAGTNTTQLATTAFVTTAVANKSVPTATTTTPKMDGTAAVGSETKWAKGDHVHPTDTSRAPLASPAFTGTPTAPTATAGTNTTQVATTAFVKAAVDAKTVPSASSTSPKMDGTATVGTETAFARGDHIHPTDTSRAPLASPALTGTPTAPTASAGTNTTQIATTAFVSAAIKTQTDKMGAANGYATLDENAKVYAYQITKTMVEVTASKTLALTDDGKWLNVTASSAVTITVPANASVALPIGAEIDVCRWGTGTVTFAAASGVTIQNAEGTSIPAQNTVAHLKKIATNYWLLRYEYQDTSTLAPKASPALTGTPTAPTAASGTANTQIATTEFVANALGNNSGILKVNCGTLSVLPTTINSSDITATMELVRAEVGTTDVQDGDWTVTTANGSVTISGSISGATTLVLYLSEVRTAS